MIEISSDPLEFDVSRTAFGAPAFANGSPHCHAVRASEVLSKEFVGPAGVGVESPAM